HSRCGSICQPLAPFGFCCCGAARDLHSFPTRRSSDLERAVSQLLGGSCQVPLAAYAQLQGDVLTLRALVAQPDGTRVIRCQHAGPAGQALAIGQAAAQDLLANGADAILTQLQDAPAS